MKLGQSIVLAAVATLSATCCIATANAKQQDVSRGQTSSVQQGKTMTTDELQQRGKQLRADIDQEYEKLSAAHALSALNGNDITAIVIRYIPIDTKFDDAEAILRAGGFKVGARPGPNAPSGIIKNRPDRYDVIGSLAPYKEKFPSRTDIYINLTPKTPDSYGLVSQVSGGITVSMP